MSDVKQCPFINAGLITQRPGPLAGQRNVNVTHYLSPCGEKQCKMWDAGREECLFVLGLRKYIGVAMGPVTEQDKVMDEIVEKIIEQNR